MNSNKTKINPAMTQDFRLEVKKSFGNEYVKVYLRDNTIINNIKNLLISLKSVENINITQNKRDDLTVYPTKFYSGEQLKIEISKKLSKYFEYQNVIEHESEKSVFNIQHKTQIISKITDDNSPQKKIVSLEKTKQISRKYLISFIIMLLGVFCFTPLRNILFKKESEPKIEEQINTETYNDIKNQTNNYFKESESKKLNFSSSFSLLKDQNNQLNILAIFNNLSAFVGTKPKIQIIIYGIKIDNHPMQLMPSKNVSKEREPFHTNNFSEFLKHKIPITGIYTSSKSYSENILYPNDKLSFYLISKPYSPFKNHKYAIGQLDCLFKESKRQTKYYIFDFINEKKSNVIYETSNNITLLLSKYDSLVNKGGVYQGK